MKRIFALLALVILFASCKKDFPGVTSYQNMYLIIQPEKAEVQGMFGTNLQLMVVQQLASKEDDRPYYLGEIEGFTFEKGITQVVYVRREKLANPPQDASSHRYVLLRVVSKKAE